MWDRKEKKKFRKGFSGSEENGRNGDGSKARNSAEKRARFIASLTPEERAERRRKLEKEGGSYEDGGMPCNKKKNKMAALAKLAKTGSSK